MGEQFNRASSLRGLCRAAKKTLQGVGHKDGPQEFNTTRLGSCARLRRDVCHKRYHARRGTPVEIFRPKHRIATAPWYRDRVWQRSMCLCGVYDDLTRGFIPENFACQAGKGADLAIRTVINMLQSLHRAAPGATVWGKHLDIHRYFPSTPQEEIKALDRERITETLFLPYLFEIIDMQPDPRSPEEIAADAHGRRGTGLGSQINQLNQVALLDELDHQIKARCPCYARYNDDFLLLSHDKKTPRQCEALIKAWCSKKGLELTDKAGLFRAEDGFYFLRKKFILKSTGKIVIRLHPKALAEERQTLRNLKRLLDKGERNMDQVKAHYQSWIANAEYAGDGPIRAMDKFYTALFRQKPDYKRKRRYLYGNRHDSERKNPPAGGRKRTADGTKRNAGGSSGLCGHDDRRGAAGGGDKP